MNSHNCKHCKGQRWVLAYEKELSLQRVGLHMTDIPAAIFEQIPLTQLFHCHCQIGILLPHLNQGRTDCLECSGTTWRFGEFAEDMSYRWKKVTDLSLDEAMSLSCDYFMRCPCGFEEQVPKTPDKVFALPRLTIPRFGFTF